MFKCFPDSDLPWRRISSFFFLAKGNKSGEISIFSKLLRLVPTARKRATTGRHRHSEASFYTGLRETLPGLLRALIVAALVVRPIMHFLFRLVKLRNARMSWYRYEEYGMAFLKLSKSEYYLQLCCIIGKKNAVASKKQFPRSLFLFVVGCDLRNCVRRETHPKSRLGHPSSPQIYAFRALFFWRFWEYLLKAKAITKRENSPLAVSGVKVCSPPGRKGVECIVPSSLFTRKRGHELDMSPVQVR